MADSQVQINVSKDVIDAHVRSAVAAVLNRDPEGLIRAVVDVAMRQPAGGYSRTTVWEEAVNKMIQDVARATFEKWVEEQKPAIEAAVRARLNGKDRKDMIAKVCERLVGALGSFRVRLDVE